MKAFKVEFSYTDEAYLYIAAETPEAAQAGAEDMLKNVKSPIVTGVSEITGDVDITASATLN